MIGIYFSGTGNTRHLVKHFLSSYETEVRMYSMETQEVTQHIEGNTEILFAYPIYFSNLPKIVRDFIETHSSLWAGKKIFIMATMGLFSGDGTGCAARLFQKYGAEVVGGLHLKMPDCIGDEKALKKPLGKNKALVQAAEVKVSEAVTLLKAGAPTQEGLGFLYHMAGLFGQRLWFYHKTQRYSDKLKIDMEKCTGCGVCTKLCPMQNLILKDKKAGSANKCTMCYRCVSNCPHQAITLLGHKLYEQSRIEKYL